MRRSGVVLGYLRRASRGLSPYQPVPPAGGSNSRRSFSARSSNSGLRRRAQSPRDVRAFLADVGFKTALGEPFVDLDPGRAHGRLAGSLRARPTVEIDDALAFLDKGGRANVRRITESLGEGAASPDAASQVGDAIMRLRSATDALGGLLSELRAQRSDLSGLVADGRVVLDTLASRSAQLRSLTGDARRTLAPLAAQRAALAAVLDRVPGLLRDSSATLLQSRSLITSASPVVRQVTDAAPSLTSALDATPASTTALQTLLAQAGAIRTSVVPALTMLQSLAKPGSTALGLLGPALADVIPTARYLGPRGNTIAAWFANTADLGSHGDRRGDWARFFVMFDPSTLLGSKSGAPPGNAYTAPDDAAHNEPYRPGDFPRVMPYSPALGRG